MVPERVSNLPSPPRRGTTKAPRRTKEETYGTFPGPGYYSLGAQNTGTLNTIATLQLRTDSEI